MLLQHHWLRRFDVVGQLLAAWVVLNGFTLAARKTPSHQLFPRKSCIFVVLSQWTSAFETSSLPGCNFKAHRRTSLQATDDAPLLLATTWLQTASRPSPSWVSTVVSLLVWSHVEYCAECLECTFKEGQVRVEQGCHQLVSPTSLTLSCSQRPRSHVEHLHFL